MQSCKIPPALLQVCRYRLYSRKLENKVAFWKRQWPLFPGGVSPTAVPDRAEECVQGVRGVFSSIFLLRERRAALPPSSFGGGKELRSHTCTGKDNRQKNISIKIILWFTSNWCVRFYQVLLRWAVQQGVPVLPKSSNPDRIQRNTELFDFSLSDADMDKLSTLDCGLRYCWDPSKVAWHAMVWMFFSFHCCIGDWSLQPPCEKISLNHVARNCCDSPLVEYEWVFFFAQ